MASSISLSAKLNSSSRLVIFPPHNDIISCNMTQVLFRRKSKLLTTRLKISSKDCHSEEPDEDGTKRRKISTWKKWVVGVSLSLILPSYRRKLGPWGILKNRINEVVETTETVSEVVEDVAEDVKNLAEELERRLPAKNHNGERLKEALDLVEKLAEETIKTTDLVQELSDKVEEAEEMLEDALVIAEARKPKEKDRDKH